MNQNNTYLKVLGFQLKQQLESNNLNEYLIEDKLFDQQIKKSFELIKNLNPDLVIYPELSYKDENEKVFKELSNNRLIIAGSIYKDRINKTIIFQNKEKFEIPKKYASGREPMTRIIENKTIEDFIKNNLKEHTFIIKNKKIIVLNCMEYYHTAYYIARNIKDVFAIISPCVNNNINVFLEETKAIHNHNENIYSFIVNCVSTLDKEIYSTGNSYVFGPIQHHEKDWLKLENINSEKHNASILTLPKTNSYFYGEFRNNLTPYGRSDNYENNPKNIKVSSILKEEIK